MGLVDALFEKAVGDVFTVVVAQVALLAQSVQRSDCCGINGKCVRQALDGGLVVPWFAGRCSVTEFKSAASAVARMAV